MKSYQTTRKTRREDPATKDLDKEEIRLLLKRRRRLLPTYPTLLERKRLINLTTNSLSATIVIQRMAQLELQRTPSRNKEEVR